MYYKKYSYKDFSIEPIKFIEDIDKQCSDVFRFSIDESKLVYVNSPKLIAEVLSEKWPLFIKEFGYKKSREVINKNLFSIETVWPKQKEFQIMSSNINDVVIQHFFNIRTGEPLKLFENAKELTMEVFLQTLLKGNVKAGVTTRDIREKTEEVIDGLGKIILQFPINSLENEVLELEEEKLYSKYFDLFVDSTECEHASKARAVTTILAGYEQIATIIFYTVAHFSENNIQLKTPLDYRNFLNEVIRMHSPIWTIMRRPKEDVNIGGHSLSVDDIIVTSPWCMAYNEKYFDSPYEFMPSRWNKKIEKFSFFPFSHGPRVCKGEGFVRSFLNDVLKQLQFYDGIKVIPHSTCIRNMVKVSAVPSKNTMCIFNN